MNPWPLACKASALPTELHPLHLRIPNYRQGLTQALSADTPPSLGLAGIEPSTSRLSGARSNQLSYRPLYPTSLNPIYLYKKKTSGELSGIYLLLFKEVIQPHLPVRLPCYDFTPLTGPSLTSPLLTVGVTGFRKNQLGWCDGRCVQGPRTYSPQYC